MSIHDLAAEHLLLIVEVMENRDLLSLMLTCRHMFDFLKIYLEDRRFRIICATHHLPTEKFWALKDVLHYIDLGADLSVLFPFFQLALLHLEKDAFTDAIIRLAYDRALEYQDKKKQLELLEWIWGQFDQKPVTLLPVAKRMYDLSPSHAKKVAMEDLGGRYAKTTIGIRLIPYTGLKPRYFAEWKEDLGVWHRSNEQEVIITFSTLPPAYKAFREMHRKRSILYESYAQKTEPLLQMPFQDNTVWLQERLQRKFQASKSAVAQSGFGLMPTVGHQPWVRFL